MSHTSVIDIHAKVAPPMLAAFDDSKTVLLGGGNQLFRPLVRQELQRMWISGFWRDLVAVAVTGLLKKLSKGASL
jgi:hypothetical protein